MHTKSTILENSDHTRAKIDSKLIMILLMQTNLKFSLL